MKVLAVGERFNQREWRPQPEMEFSFDLRVRMGLYNKGPRRAFLDNLGIRWNDGINLLWPHPVPGTWDPHEARDVVIAIGLDVIKYDTVLLFGRRVCEAFLIPFRVGEVYPWGIERQVTNVIPLPHPSGRSRLWHHPNTIKIIEKLAENWR